VNRIEAAAQTLLSQGESAADAHDWETAIARADTVLHLGSTDCRAPALRLRALEALSATALREATTHASAGPGEVRSLLELRGLADQRGCGATGLGINANAEYPRGTLEEVAARVTELAPLPVVASEVLTITNDDTASTDDLSKWISSDSALTASVLRLANSAYYGRSRHVETVREAVVLLGIREVRTIAMTSLLVDTLSNVATIDYKSYWRFSLTVGLLAEMQALVSGRGRELAFAAGVLHNIGMLALDIADSAGLREAATIDPAPGLRRFEDRERHVFGFTSADLGAQLAANWGFPESLTRAIALHHSRLSELAGTELTVEYVVKARVFARASGLSDGIESNVPRGLPDEWAGPTLNSAVDMVGGIEGITNRIDALLEGAFAA
jgi:HD-like signal output (HDOD) protein